MQAVTFGAFPAAEVLVSRLEKLGDPHVTMKVSRTLQDFNEGLAHIAQIAHPRYRQRCALLWRDDFLNRVAIHATVDGYVKNVINTYAKDVLTEDDTEQED